MLLLIALSAFMATVLGGIFALYLKDRLHLLLGFSAGAVIGVAFFDLMPESLQLLSGSHDSLFGTSLIALGFALYLILDRIIVLHHHHEDEHHEHEVRGTWGASTLSIHSFLDGVGIGLAFQVSPSVGLIVTAAVLTHDFSDGINTVNMIIKNEGTPRRALKFLLIDALTPALGILSTFFITVNQSQLGIILAIFTGFFLYIGTSDLLPESHHEHPKSWTTIATIFGMLSLYLIIRVVG